MAHLFIRIALASSRKCFVCILDILPYVGDDCFQLVEGHPTFVGMRHLITHVSYQIRSRGARIIFLLCYLSVCSCETHPKKILHRRRNGKLAEPN